MNETLYVALWWGAICAIVAFVFGYHLGRYTGWKRGFGVAVDAFMSTTTESTGKDNYTNNRGANEKQ